MTNEQPNPMTPPEWFTQTNVAPPTPPKQPQRKAARIIIAVIILALLIASVVLIIVSRKDSSSNTTTAECFEPKTYGYLLKTINDNAAESLTLAGVVSDEPLYIYEVYFQPGMTDFNLAIASNPVGLLEAVGKYYKENHQDVPFTVQLESYDLDSNLAGRRLDTVKQILIKAGLNEDAIKIITPLDQSRESTDTEEIDEGEEYTDSDVDGLPVSVSIFPTPAKVCNP